MATRVTAWTGKSDEYTEDAIDLTKELAEVMRSDDFDGLESSVLTPELFERVKFDVTKKKWGALWRFWERGYWSRIWVVQELCCSGNMWSETEDRCLIRCGHFEVTKHAFVNSCGLYMLLGLSVRYFVNLEDAIPEPFQTAVARGLPPAINMFNALNHCHQDNPANISIINILSATRAFHATDIRDKLYAILGLSRNDERLIAPDYSKPSSQVYMELVQGVIERDRNLEAISENRSDKKDFGPSWIPELNVRLSYGPGWAFEHRLYKAAGDSSTEATFDIQNKLMGIKGLHAGVLSMVIGPFEMKSEAASQSEPQTFTVSTAQQVRGWDFPWTGLKNLQKTLTPSQKDMFWRTLVMDADVSDFNNVIMPAPAEWGLMHSVVFESGPVPADFEPDLPQLERAHHYTRDWSAHMEATIMNRCFFRTSCGRMGLGPLHSKEGDVVALLYGGDHFIVLRPKGDYYELIGDAYVQGLMQGELLEKAEGEQVFTLC